MLFSQVFLLIMFAPKDVLINIQFLKYSMYSLVKC